MEEFLMVFRSAGMGDFKPAPEQMQAIEKQWADWFSSLAAQGIYAGGSRPAMEGKTITPGNIVTDGPYAEVKEILMGTSIIKANSIDEAVEIAKGCPILLAGGSVEVRPLIIMNF